MCRSVLADAPLCRVIGTRTASQRETESASHSDSECGLIAADGWKGEETSDWGQAKGRRGRDKGSEGSCRLGGLARREGRHDRLCPSSYCRGNTSLIAVCSVLHDRERDAVIVAAAFAAVVENDGYRAAIAHRSASFPTTQQWVIGRHPRPGWTQILDVSA